MIRVDVPRGGAATTRPALMGEIVVEAPSGAPAAGSLYLDGRSVGAVPAIIDSVAVGNHVVEIRSAEGVLWQANVTVRDGSVSRVEIPADPATPQK